MNGLPGLCLGIPLRRIMKEVDFNKYCAMCKYKNAAQEVEPCNECLTCGAREDSHKPINFKEAKEES